MARLLIRIPLGPGASLGALSAVVEDLSVLQDLGLRVDAVAARRDAEGHIERLWTDQPGQLVEQSLRVDERTAGDIQRLLDQRQQDEQIRERLESAPLELSFEEWYRQQRRSGLKGSWFVPPPFLWTSKSTDMRLSEVAPDLFARLVTEETGRRLPVVPKVERLTYENPVELILVIGAALAGAGFKFGTFTEIAKLIRDWSADKRKAAADARKAVAEGRQAEARVEREEAEVERTRAETRELNARASKTEVETELLRRFAQQTNRLDDLVEVGVAPRELQAVAQLSATNVEVEVVDEDG